MSEKDTFGLRLRRARERSGLSLQAIADHTKVPVTLWHAMERNDFSRWPSGVFARAYVRDFAELVGLDPVETVEEFCRWFPQGDRRAYRVIRSHAEIVGVSPQYADDALPPEGDRRAAQPGGPASRSFIATPVGQRVVGAGCDVIAVTAISTIAARLLDIGFLSTLGIVSVAYYSIGGALVGRSPGVALAELLLHRRPHLVRVRQRHIPA